MEIKLNQFNAVKEKKSPIEDPSQEGALQSHGNRFYLFLYSTPTTTIIQTILYLVSDSLFSYIILIFVIFLLENILMLKVIHPPIIFLQLHSSNLCSFPSI